MDSKNIIAAITLSTAVIVLYSLFFVPEKKITDQNLVEENKIQKNTDTPSLNENKVSKKLSRNEALKESERINFENDSIIGSISLKGAAIDDLTFKNYNISLEDNSNVTLLGPRKFEDSYLIESGFITSDKNIDIPNADTIWSVEGNNKLTSKSPIELFWKNNQGLIFKKNISLDN